MFSQLVWSLALGSAVATGYMLLDFYKGREEETPGYIITGCMCAAVSFLLRVLIP